MKSQRHIIRHTRGDYIFLGIDWAVLILFLIVIAYPLIFVIMSSFSGGMNSMTLYLMPSRFTLEGYKSIFQYKDVWIGFRNSAMYVVLGTSISMTVTICCAYPLSRRDFKGGKIMMALCIFTMYFSGGMIPTYLVVRSLNMMDTIWSVIVPNCLVVFNMIVMRTYFSTQIPNELRDAAAIDGCGDFRFLATIVLPLSKAIVAVVGMYYAVSIWNGYFSAMLYLTSRDKFPLTLFLREILVLGQFTQGMESNLSSELASQLAERAELMKYSVIVVSCLPMIVLYPFVQKYFVKGVMIGAIKG